MLNERKGKLAFKTMGMSQKDIFCNPRHNNVTEFTKENAVVLHKTLCISLQFVYGNEFALTLLSQTSEGVVISLSLSLFSSLLHELPSPDPANPPVCECEW